MGLGVKSKLASTSLADRVVTQQGETGVPGRTLPFPSKGTHPGESSRMLERKLTMCSCSSEEVILAKMKLMGSRGIPLMVTALNLAWGWDGSQGTQEESELGNGLLLSKGLQGMDVQGPSVAKN